MHYAGLAIDLHSSAPDELAGAMRRLGFTVLWKVPGHYGHVHVEVPGAAALVSASSVPRPPRRPRT
jgi:hypothetical protein